MELYPFGAIKSIKEMMLDFERCSKNASWPIPLVFVEII
jgi:hypothetical protein